MKFHLRFQQCLLQWITITQKWNTQTDNKNLIDCYRMSCLNPFYVVQFEFREVDSSLVFFIKISLHPKYCTSPNQFAVTTSITKCPIMRKRNCLTTWKRKREKIARRKKSREECWQQIKLVNWLFWCLVQGLRHEILRDSLNRI